MVAYTLLALLLASAPALLVRADVTPDVPGPGSVYKEGETCEIHWEGDKVSTTQWKNMAIELMTGDNFNMVHITTVATAQDGTVDGKFEYPCPGVTPNSAIYFYQFTALNSNTTWTTRFTIAGADGSTTDPTEQNQPGTNAPIPWGTGALKDPSKAVAAPSFGSTTSASNSAALPGVSTTTASSGSGTNPAASTSTSKNTMTSVKSSPSAGTTPAGQNTNTNNTSTANNNAAIESVKLSRAVTVLVGSALAFAFFV